MQGILLYSHLPYYLNPLLVLFHIYVTEVYQQPFINLLISYAIIPLIDQFLPDDFTNPTPEEAKVLKKQFKWVLPLYFYVLIEWVALFWTFDYISRPDTSLKSTIILTIVLGQITGGGFLYSHELFHKQGFIPKSVGVLNLLNNLYLHFFSEHTLGHHKNVCTPTDPATAKINQSVYDFINSSMMYSFINSWKREEKILKKSGKPALSIHNRMIQWSFLEILFTLVIWKFWGFKCFVVFLIQAWHSINLLESVNYIRHYGLTRKKLENGKYEPVTIKHSWNAPQALQNTILLKLQRHSDHHAFPDKPYQILESSKESPNLPCGYNVCILASHFPSVWFKLINPLVEATNQDGKPTPSQLAQTASTLKS